MHSVEEKFQKSKLWTKIGDEWTSTRNRRALLEDWTCFLHGALIGFAILIVTLPTGPLKVAVALGWLVTLLACIIANCVLFAFSRREWKIFNKIVSLDPAAANHPWFSGKLGKVLAFIQRRKIRAALFDDSYVFPVRSLKKFL